MEREILVSVDREDTRVAIRENGQLVAVELERPLTRRIVGNIYKGRVENVLPGMQACFVNIGLERNAFLYVDDARATPFEELDEEPPRPVRQLTIKDLVKPGQEVVVQVEKEPLGTKGARVTRNLSIPGRYLVFLPAADYVGVSRRIGADEERERLKALARQLRPPHTGLIVRTAAEGRQRDELAEDVARLQEIWETIQRRARKAPVPSLLYKDLGLAHEVLRDELTPDVSKIYVDEPHEFERVRETVRQYAPQMVDRVCLYTDHKRPLFEAFGVDEELDQATARKVWLKSGGYLVIDQTEALTSIDVNTGKYVGTKNLEDTIYRTNLEAAREIARQLRLRDIGGIIIIDFIDMAVPQHRQNVVEALQAALARDRTKSSVLGFTHLGLVEMTRKKGRQNLLHLQTRPCPYCEGYGRVLTEEAMSRRVRREVKRTLRGSPAEAILIEVHPSVASLLIGPGGQNLRQLEKDTGRTVYVRGCSDCHGEEMRIKALGSKEEVEAQALPVRSGQLIELEVEEPHVSHEGDGIARLEGYVIDIEGAAQRVGEKLQVQITKAYRTYAKARIVS